MTDVRVDVHDIQSEDHRRSIAVASAVMDRIYATQSWRTPVAMRTDRWLTRWWTYVAYGWGVVLIATLTFFGVNMIQGNDAAPVQWTAGVIDVDALGDDSAFVMDMPMDVHMASIGDPIILADVSMTDRIAHAEPLAFGLIVLLMLLGCWLFRRPL